MCPTESSEGRFWAGLLMALEERIVIQQVWDGMRVKKPFKAGHSEQINSQILWGFSNLNQMKKTDAVSEIFSVTAAFESVLFSSEWIWTCDTEIFWHLQIFKSENNSKVLLTRKYFRRATVTGNNKRMFKVSPKHQWWLKKIQKFLFKLYWLARHSLKWRPVGLKFEGTSENLPEAG